MKQKIQQCYPTVQMLEAVDGLFWREQGGQGLVTSAAMAVVLEEGFAPTEMLFGTGAELMWNPAGGINQGAFLLALRLKMQYQPSSTTRFSRPFA